MHRLGRDRRPLCCGSWSRLGGNAVGRSFLYALLLLLGGSDHFHTRRDLYCESAHCSEVMSLNVIDAMDGTAAILTLASVLLQ